MNLIDKQDIVALKMSEQPDQIAPFLQSRTGRDGKIPPHLIGNDVGQSGFPKTRWAVQKHMIDGFVSLHGCLDGNLKRFNDFGLSDIIRHAFRTQR